MTERSTDQRRPPASGNFEVRSFAPLIGNATVHFCDRFLDKRSPLSKRMIQAAEGVRLNRAGHSGAGPARNELSHLNDHRASLQGLLLDYADFLRERKLRQWTRDDPEAQAVRALGMRTQGTASASDYSVWLQSTAPGSVANCIICLIHQAIEELDTEIPPGQTTPFASTATLSSIPATSTAVSSGVIPGAPSCPKCGKPMALRTARSGKRPGSQFWGCIAYPRCNGLRKLDG